MPTKNDITGDTLKSRSNTKSYSENYDKIFAGQRQKGSWVYVEGKGLVPRSEIPRKPRPKTPMFFTRGFFDAYESPSTGQVITNSKQRDYDLKASGCREWEGLQTEQQESARQKEYQEKEFEQTIEKGVEETYRELKSGAIKPETKIDTGWLADE